MRLCAIAFILLSLAVTAVAADIDGKWTGSVSTPNGDLPVAFTFKADGNKLTGSMTGIDGTEYPIESGTIDGANLAFSVTLNFNGNSIPLSYKGVASADQIKFSADFNGQAFEFVVKKAG